MANTFISTSIATGLVIEASHVTQSADAFTGTEAYDITISGSLTNTGPSTLTGLTNLVASDASNLTLEINESASFNFLTGGPNSGSFIVQTSPDTGNGELQVFTGQGTAVIASQNIPNHIFGIKYSSGSGASEGELSMAVGKRNLTSVGGANQNNFYVSYEPSGILTNAQGELEFFVGEHQNVGYGVLSVYRGGASSLTQTSSFAGYFSSSAFPNQQQYTRPFAISTLSQVNDSNPAFVINKNVTDLTTSNFSVDYGGNVTASGKIAVGSTIPAASGYSGITAKFDGGAFFNITEETTSVFGIYDSPDGADILRIDTDPDHFLIDPINNGYNVGIGTASPAEKLTILGNVSASGNGIFKAGKPITTHTSSPISSSNANAGGYHIVGGNLTASIVLDSTAPVGAEYEFFQSSSTGQFLFESASGTTVISKNGSMRLAQQGSSAVLKKVSTTTFHLMGDLT